MMDEPLISIISPVYSVEPYIHEYMHSVLSQTYANLEIICVENASPDRCGDILDEYTRRDARLRVVHLDSAGYAKAVNHGLDIATGEYIGFVDPDDWIAPDYYEHALGLALRVDADIVISGFYQEHPTRSEIMENAQPIEAVFDDRNAAFRYGFDADVYKGFRMYLWNKLFRRKLFSRDSKGNDAGGVAGANTSLRLDPQYVTGLDTLLTAECFMRCDRFAYDAKPHYHYRIREGSIIRSADFAARLGEAAVLEKLVCELEAKAYDADVVSLLERCHTAYADRLVAYALSTGDEADLEAAQSLAGKYR